MLLVVLIFLLANFTLLSAIIAFLSTIFTLRLAISTFTSNLLDVISDFFDTIMNKTIIRDEDLKEWFLVALYFYMSFYH